MQGTAREWAPTAFDVEFGQINTAAGDTRLGVSQQFQLPAVYRRQRELLTQQ
jgi:hypothetical protein